MKYSLKDVFSDDAGQIDTGRSQSGVGTSTKKQVCNKLNLKVKNNFFLIFNYYEFKSYFQTF